MNICGWRGVSRRIQTEKSMQSFPTMKSFHFYSFCWFSLLFPLGPSYENDITALLVGWVGGCVSCPILHFFSCDFPLHLWPLNSVICLCILHYYYCYHNFILFSSSSEHFVQRLLSDIEKMSKFKRMKSTKKFAF